MYKCPCCEQATLEEGRGNFEICPICGWEDDPVQRDNPDEMGGANKLSLSQSQEVYRMICRVVQNRMYTTLMNSAKRAGINLPSAYGGDHIHNRV